MGMVTIAWDPEAEQDVLEELGEDGFDALTSYLAFNPESGSLIPGAGGVRKLRWQAAGRGKRSGSRVIYFYFATEAPLYVFAYYKKNEKTDLTTEEKTELKEIVKGLVRSYRARCGNDAAE